MNHDPQDQLLEERLHDLALTADVPHVPIADDVARGRHRVRRQRLGVAGAALGTAAVLGVGAALLGGGGGDPSGGSAPEVAATGNATDPAETAPTSPPSPSAPPADERTADEALDDWRDIVADHLDPRGRHLDKRVTNVQSSGTGFGTKLGWSNPGEEGLGEVQLYVGDGGGGFAEGCAGRCRDVTVDGIEAKVRESDGETYVAAERDGFTVSIWIDDLFGNNSLVPVSGLDVPVADLVRLVGDEGFTKPTRKQLDTLMDVTFG